MEVNPYLPPEGGYATEVRQQPGRMAMASFVINLVLPLTMLSMVGLLVVGPKTAQSTMVVGTIGLLSLVMDFIAVGLGIVGLLQTGNARLLVAVGAIFAVAVLGMVALFFAG